MRIVSILLALAFSTSCFAQKNKQVVSVAFYNVENLFDTEDDPTKEDDEFTPNGRQHYTPDIYKQKLHNLAYVLNQIGTDVAKDGPAVIGMAEVENRKVLGDLVQQKEIAGKGYRYILFDGPDPRGIDVALLYRPSVFKPLHSTPIKVKVTEDDHKEAARDILYVRGVLVKDTVHVLVNHWPSRREGKQETAVKRRDVALVNKRITDSLLRLNANASIIVMGDFNDDPTDASIKTLGANENAPELSRYELYNPWINIYRSGSGTLAYHDRWNLFDQIILSKRLAQTKKGLSYLKAEIFNKPFLQQQYGKYKGYPNRSFSRNRWTNGYSDHFPVVLYFNAN